MIFLPLNVENRVLVDDFNNLLKGNRGLGSPLLFSYLVVSPRVNNLISALYISLVMDVDQKPNVLRLSVKLQEKGHGCLLVLRENDFIRMPRNLLGFHTT